MRLMRYCGLELDSFDRRTGKAEFDVPKSGDHMDESP